MFLLDNNQCVSKLLRVAVLVQKYNMHTDEQQRQSLARALNCNTDVQIGDLSSIFYTTLYSTKNTQKEDCETPQHVQNVCTKRLLKAEAELLNGTREPDEVQDCFVEGLCMMLAAMNVAISRFKVGTVMSHHMVCNGGTRFTFSHEFGNLLVS